MAVVPPIEVLRDNPCFAGLSASEAAAILARCQDRAFRAGDVLVREGGPGEAVIFVLAGQVDLKRGERVLATVGPGAVVGELALLDEARHPSGAVARGTGTAAVLPASELRALLDAGDPAALVLVQGLIATVCKRLGVVNELVRQELLGPPENVFQRLWSRVWGRS